MKSLNIASIILLISLSAISQQKISLFDCRKMTLENSKELLISNKQIEKAKTEKKAMISNYLPKLSASGTMIYREDIEEELILPTMIPDPATGELVPNVMINPLTGEQVTAADGTPVFNSYAWMPLELSLQGAFMAGVTLEQPIFAGGKIITGNQMANIGLKMAETNLILQEMTVINEADKAYWLYISVKDKVKLAEQYIILLDSLTITISNSYQAGLINRNEVLKVQVQHNQASLELQKAHSGLRLVQMSLCRIMGLDLNAKIELTDTIISLNNKTVEMFGSEDVTQRPEYILMQNSIELEDKKIRLARADYLPSAGISAGYNYIDGIKMNGIKREGDLSANLIGSVSIPLFHWGEGVNKIKSAKIDKEIKVFEFENNVTLLKLEMEKARLDLKDALTRIKLLEKSVEQSEENLRLSTNNYNAGMEPLLNLLEAQTQWKKSKSEMIDAKIDFKVKETNYLKTTGKLTTETN